MALEAFVAKRDEKIHAAINDYLLYQKKSSMENLSEHHQEHCRLNKDGGNEAESKRKQWTRKND